MTGAGGFWRILTTACVLGAASHALAAEDGVWAVSKSSGEVWMTTTGAQQVSLSQEEVLKPGDTIRTGRNGRVLLVRGEETILVSPNSVVGLPAEKKDGLATTIVQQAGSILLEVEKQSVKHFEVETPYLAAVVKGTQFRVSVNAASTSVDVFRGQVEVADFKSGQVVQVMPGQVATAFARGESGLSLSGSGTLNPIEQGKPRASSLERIPVPKTGLTAPRQAANGQLIRALGHLLPVKPGAASPQRTAGGASAKSGVTRISASLGEVRLNFQKVTHGLARGSAAVFGSTRTAANKDTVWTSGEAAAATGIGNGSGLGTSNVAGTSGGNAATSTSAAAASGATASTATVAAAADNSGNGNGNAKANGNGKNNGNGNNGNGNGNNANGNNGNGNNGNGNGHGH
jgi:ferric-dicitrate binding protein FerR (iron transport regulator)